MTARCSGIRSAGGWSSRSATRTPAAPTPFTTARSHQGPRPHIHRGHDEAFYVLEGELTVRVGPRTIVAPAGSFVVVPRGAVHQPSNPGTRPTRVLQAVPDDPAVQKRLAAFTAKYDCEFAEFPPGP